MFRLIKKMITGSMDWFLYTFLSEKQKAFLSNLFTDKQKEKLKQITKNGKKQAQRQKLKRIKHHLYNLGFTERGLTELETVYSASRDSYMKRLAAWELTLWHANKYTKDGARQALEYIDPSIDGEKDQNQLRKAAILKAECHEMLHEIEEGKRIITKSLENQKHPDLYMAAANLEESIDERVEWINQALNVYNIQPILFSTNNETVTYDDLKTEPIDKKIEEGPKVSVILPAFNAESGVRIAIESILNQTWQNIELLAVDDCSPDNTAEVIKEYSQKDSRVIFLSTPTNSGPYVARNIALKEATGEYVTVNDADDWSHAEKIEKQVTHLIENKETIANTSEHARLTEDLKLYRRGTPGIYIFPNMSSLMFRREPVVQELGSWDSVRFAADGEFKRRLIKAFGKNSYVDLNTGPLSLPRQSVASLTGSSAFGYNGFFMGVRKEYVESLEFHHARTDTFYYPYPQDERPFPVPEPMWPNRENKPSGRRSFDAIIASDFRILEENSTVIEEIQRQKAAGIRLGLIQMYQYDLDIENTIDKDVRNLLDGDQIQMVVYGEKITTKDLHIINPVVLEDWQQYIPQVDAGNIHVIVNQLPTQGEKRFYNVEHCLSQLEAYFDNPGIWYPLHSSIRESLITNHQDELKAINLADENWQNRAGNYE
ncbi:glycosyltransferase involved in cell wall biosynthesis [Virgibacillus natechei]|uniref:Glycosyltransferase involved in cell wall biosynthesis n=1 Tax=Virgibacillus natechei TaxID=1216297 RepID=A0ABS4IKU2_9BACI|nr:glycosyltransferase family 2 protein [Virgibacillus natechei]MBP1971483.1 glycosyltransferase involved in cell wall biosynthesis [Virgibacillus natechei]UZD12537.1 glycosyltransferase [Virgibacillus natechei]